MKMYLWSFMLAVMLAFSFTATAIPNTPPDPVFASVAGDQATIPIVLAASPYLVDSKTGKYLGNLNNNQYDTNSVANEFGRYGSKYSSDSINNEFCRYGSPYSNDSVNNPYGNNSPVIIHPD